MRFLASVAQSTDRIAFGSCSSVIYAGGSTDPSLSYRHGNRGFAAYNLSAENLPAKYLLGHDFVAGFVPSPSYSSVYVARQRPGYVAGGSGYYVVDVESEFDYKIGCGWGYSFALDVHISGTWLVNFTGREGDQAGRLIRWNHPAGSTPHIGWDVSLKDEYSYVSRVACDPVHNRVVSLELESGQPVTEQVYEITVRDSASGIVLRIVPIPTRIVDRLLFSPDGQQLVSQSGTSIFVWDATDLARKPTKVRGSGRKHFTDIAFTPDSRYLLATSNDQTVTVYDTASWQVSRTFTWDIGRMRSVAVSPDGLLAAAGGDRGKIVVWDLDM